MRLELTDIKSVLLPTGYLVQMYSYGSDSGLALHVDADGKPTKCKE